RLSRVAEALAAARGYARKTRRFVTVSYVLLDGVNDSPEQARELARILAGSGFHVNLIPLNAVPGVALSPSPRERAQVFWEELRRAGIACHFRRARGADASAACGQLRLRERTRA
ncbi:23S rRNA (adenine(2503)-C(2))-methyltransferase RlmN, partial [bacterium]|nr:23S rRNA (adenine(2503)-C(2))-methyltransferase RlmN [bacterium]